MYVIDLWVYFTSELSQNRHLQDATVPTLRVLEREPVRSSRDRWGCWQRFGNAIPVQAFADHLRSSYRGAGRVEPPKAIG